MSIYKSPYYKSVYFDSPYFPEGGDQPASQFVDYSVVARQGLAQLITDGKTNLQFADNDFTVEETWLPIEELIELKKDHAHGKLYLVAMPYDEENISRSNAAKDMVSVLIGFQKGGIDPNNVSVLDGLASLISQIKYVCRKFDPDNFSYSKTETMRDPDSGLPFGMATLKQARVFETYFVVHYNLILV